MDEQNVFQNGFEDSLGAAAVQIELKQPNVESGGEAASDSISNSLSGLCIPKQEPAPPPTSSPLPPPADPTGTSFLRQALLGKFVERLRYCAKSPHCCWWRSLVFKVC